MIEVDIPGNKNLQLGHLVLDYNGTIAVDGRLLPGVKENLGALAQKLGIHVLTADTFGTVRSALEEIPCKLAIIPEGDQDVSKLEYVQNLGRNQTVCIGNGRNDHRMLEAAVLGIAVILDEGAAAKSLMAADIVCTNIVSALELLANPLRLSATLRL